MNKISKISAIALLVIGALLAVWAVLSTQKVAAPIASGAATNGAEIPQVQAVVAARHLPAGHWVTPEDITMKQFAQMPTEGVAKASLVVGRTTAVEIAQDSAFKASSLLEGLAGLLAEGERAVSIKVDEASAVGHKLKPGDWVDVFVVLRRDGQEVEATQSRMLLPRKRVIAYGAKTHSDVPESDAKNNDAQNVIARTAVLAVQVQEVNRLLLAEQQGQVQLALRSPLDHNEPSADMLSKIPGLNLSPDSNQSVSFETNSLDSSLLALKMSELGGDRVASPIFNKSTHAAPLKLRRKSSSTGVAVEVLRGSRKEIIHY